MEKFHFLFLIFSILVLTSILLGRTEESKNNQEYPEITIANKHLKVTIYLPDSEKGYYRATRFDWSGVIKRVEYQNHHYFGEWLPSHNPNDHENIIGPCEEFGMQEPLAYKDAKPGETFIKIGIGHIERVEEPEYQFYRNYKIIKPGTWKVKKGSDWIEFTQKVEDKRGWGYLYVKKIQLVKNAPEFIIHHKLKNIGQKLIETNFYNHNFTLIDEHPIGTDYQLTFSFDIQPRRDFGGVAEARGKDLIFLENIEKPIYSEIDGLKEIVEDNQFTIQNLKTGAGFFIRGDKIPSKINLWSAAKALCPEAFLEFKINAKEKAEWSGRYTFFINPPKSN
jgi:hypothetical protein